MPGYTSSNQSTRAKEKRLTSLQLDDLRKEVLAVSPLVRVVSGYTSQMLSENAEPSRRCESVHDYRGTKVEEFGRDGWFLG